MDNDKINEIFEKKLERFYDGVLDVEGATSNLNGDEPKWEMRIGGCVVEPQIGTLEEVWENVTVEVVRMPSGELSIGWRKQENTERIV